MLLNITNLHKSIGTKTLIDDMSLIINEGEKIALIGRNGAGKSTLFKIISGQDVDFEGEITKKKDTKIILTEQEHLNIDAEMTAVDYILQDIPRFRELEHIIKSYSSNDEGNTHEYSLQDYSDAIEEFSNLGYYEIEEQVLSTLEDFGLNFDRSFDSLIKLSGGQKRFVELARVMYSNCDLALIDEPTNHMDYLGKEKFIEWLKSPRTGLINQTPTIFIVSHDRDVLKYVDKIFELRDKKVLVFNGNYDDYLKQNSLTTVSGINEYESALKKLDKLKKQINEAAKKKSYGGAPKILYDKLTKEYKELQEALKKPSFWIDQDSVENFSDKVIDKYEKYKQKNITIGKATQRGSTEHKRELLKITSLSVGYDHPLFKNLNFALEHGDKVFVKGRNGAGKTTLIKTLVNEIKVATEQNPESLQSKIFTGEVKVNQHIRLGVYEQEIDKKYLKLKLQQAIIDVYHNQRLEIDINKIRSIMSQYLFDPMRDGDLEIEKLSGGQKARFQIIKMLSNNPNLLILDEPTNHLDLPSIEELENSLLNYHGAIVYITHDNYLVEKLQGEIIRLD